MLLVLITASRVSAISNLNLTFMKRSGDNIYSFLINFTKVGESDRDHLQ